MKSFSQRKGIKPISEVLQTNSMDDALRNSIWNVLDTFVWSSPGFLFGINNSTPAKILGFSRTLWGGFYKLPADSRPSTNRAILNEIRKRFFEAEWNEVYDFVEFVIQPELRLPSYLPDRLNLALTREISAYRIIDGRVVDINSEQEVSMLDEALGDTKFAGVTAHLARALELLADRSNPDYRNSIKESISAVESMAKIVSDDSKATLAEALKALDRSGQMHKALKDGFLKLYGYTNDEDGIRHAMLEEPNLTAADAKYFLMSCTSFVNYLKAQLPS